MILRHWLALALVLIPLSISIAVSLALSPRLPSTVVTSIGLDGHLSTPATATHFLSKAACVMVLLAVLLGGALLSRAPRSACGMYGGLALFFGAHTLGVVLLNLVPAGADSSWPGMTVLGVSGAVALLGGGIIAALTVGQDSPGATPLPLSASPGATLMWFDTVTFPARLWVVIGFVQVAYIALSLVVDLPGLPSLPASWAFFAFLLIVNLHLVWLGRLTVSATHKGLSLSLGPWRWPRWTIPAATILEARPRTISPLSWGGYGLRLTPSGLGFIMRRGPGLSITRRGRLPLVLNSTDAERGAALINRLSAQDADGPGQDDRG